MEFEQALKALIGLPLAGIGRAADLLWLQFGELRPVTTRRGKKYVGEWAIHVQTSWRFVRDAKIVIAVGDLYLLPNGDDYDWTLGGDNNFDVLANNLNDSLSSTPAVVQRVHCDDVGGFSLALDDGTRFDVFPKISETIGGVEHWRLLQPDNDTDHFVCRTPDDTDAA